MILEGKNECGASSLEARDDGGLVSGNGCRDGRERDGFVICFGGRMEKRMSVMIVGVQHEQLCRCWPLMGRVLKKIKIKIGRVLEEEKVLGRMASLV